MSDDEPRSYLALIVAIGAIVWHIAHQQGLAVRLRRSVGGRCGACCSVLAVIVAGCNN
jgi:hypothetical protein